MTTHDDTSRRVADRLSEEAAHRLLARAVELDAERLSQVSIDDLRAVAGEAGISTHAFNDALAELRGAIPPSVRRKSPRERLRALAANVLPVVGVWVTMPVVIQFVLAQFPHAHRAVPGAVEFGITLAGAAVALRARGRWAAFALSAFAAGQLAGYPFLVVNPTVPLVSHPALLALWSAGLLGAAFGTYINRRLGGANREIRRRDDAQPSEVAGTASTTSRAQTTSLRLRHV